MSIASMTGIPSGTLKPYLDTLGTTCDRERRIAQKRQANSHQKYWPAKHAKRVSDSSIEAAYNNNRYADIEHAAAPVPTVKDDLTMDLIVSHAAIAGLTVTPGSQPGLWCVADLVDVPIRRVIGTVNNYLIRYKLNPLPNPDSDILSTPAASNCSSIVGT